MDAHKLTHMIVDGGGGFSAMSPIFIGCMNYFLVRVVARKQSIRLEGYSCELERN